MNIIPTLDVGVAVDLRRNGLRCIIHRADGGGWGPITGRLEVDESLREAVRREVREEAGLEIEVEGPLGVWMGEHDGVCLGVVRFAARAVGGELRPSPEVREVRWVSEAEWEQLEPFAAIQQPGLETTPWVGQLASDGIMLLDDQRTAAEVDFIATRGGIEPGDHIVALGCGGGRHMIEFARRGFGSQLGIDLDAGLIARAAGLLSAHPGCRVVRGDYTQIDFRCDHAFAWFGVFGFGESRDVQADLQVLHRAIHPGGSLCLDLVREDFFDSTVPTRRWTFDGTTFVFEIARRSDRTLYSERMYVDVDSPRRKNWSYAQRTFTVASISDLLTGSGFSVEGIWADESGSSPPECGQRLVVVARRRA